MRIVPAVDIRGGLCVNLVQGDYAQETVFSKDPVAQAIQWHELGGGIVHIVDLDGARQGEVCTETALRAMATEGVPFEVGGGIRSMAMLKTVFDAGATRAILGTAAHEDPAFLRDAVEAYPDKIVVGIDAKAGKVALEAWVSVTDTDAVEFGRQMEQAGAARIIYTDILSDGMMHGPNLDATRRLAALSATARAHHLDVLTGWVEQLIEHDRRLSLADRVLYLLHDEVLGSMEHHLDEPTEAATLAPFAFALQRQALTLANHHGDLETAERCSTEVDRLIPTLAGRWEHAHLVVDGLTAQAVALSDRFEHEAACARMEAVAGYYDAIASLFRDALPDVFPATVRSERRGRALGTWLQAECMAGLAQPERLVRARTISDEALEEFSAPGERARQYQYRCQLETWAGDPERARHYLALGIGAAGDDHRAMATRIEALDHQSRGFPLLHWLRIGAWATLHQPESPELSEFNSAFGRSSLRYDTWLREGRLHYPAHGIRRSAAVVAAGRGDLPDALALLGALRNLEPLARGEVPLALVLGSACLEVAALLRNRAPDRTRDLLHGSRGKPGVTQVIAWLDHLEKIDIPAVRTLSRRWQEVVDEAPGLDPNALKRKLIDMARPVGY